MKKKGLKPKDVEDAISSLRYRHPLSVSGMKESLLKAKKAPLKSYTKKRPW
jgi:hypothetical protein